MAPIRLAAVSCLGALLAATSCGLSGSGDPGNRRLHELAAEPVFAATPPGLSRPGAVVSTSAHKLPAGFGAGGWDGPTVIESFVSPARPATVLRFYDARARATDWLPRAAGAYGVTDVWTKTYPDGTPAYLNVTVIAEGGDWSYRLSASAPAKT